MLLAACNPTNKQKVTTKQFCPTAVCAHSESLSKYDLDLLSVVFQLRGICSAHVIPGIWEEREKATAIRNIYSCIFLVLNFRIAL